MTSIFGSEAFFQQQGNDVLNRLCALITVIFFCGQANAYVAYTHKGLSWYGFGSTNTLDYGDIKDLNSYALEESGGLRIATQKEVRDMLNSFGYGTSEETIGAGEYIRTFHSLVGDNYVGSAESFDSPFKESVLDYFYNSTESAGSWANFGFFVSDDRKNWGGAQAEYSLAVERDDDINSPNYGDILGIREFGQIDEGVWSDSFSQGYLPINTHDTAIFLVSGRHSVFSEPAILFGLFAGLASLVGIRKYRTYGV